MMAKISGHRKIIRNNSQQDPSYQCFHIYGQWFFAEQRPKKFYTIDKSPTYHRSYNGKNNGKTKIEGARIFIGVQIPNRPKSQLNDQDKNYVAKAACHQSRDNSLIIFHGMFMVQNFQCEQTSAQRGAEESGKTGCHSRYAQGPQLLSLEPKYLSKPRTCRTGYLNQRCLRPQTAPGCHAQQGRQYHGRVVLGI